ncbi:MAG: glycosyltransferase [Acidobacteriota bacterium]|nr:glycosyltransferase [Acidobacteriota bacterium]
MANLANALANDGHHVEVVHCRDAFELLKSTVAPSKFDLDPSIKVWSLASAWGPLSPLFTFATGRPGPKRRALEEILSSRFDVVHWHNISLLTGPGGLKYAGGTTLCTLHDYWWICPTHILFKDNREACLAPSCFRCQLIHRRPPQPWRTGGWLKSTLRYIDQFIAPSQFVSDRYRQSELAISSVVIPHFVPDAVRAGAAASDRESFFLYVGRIEKAKGLQTLIPLFRSSGRRLVVAGAGSFELEVRKQAEGAHNIEFLGRVAHEELGRLYSRALATIVPSLCYETFGLTVLESLKHKTPVVVSCYGALPELVTATGGGFVYRSTEELVCLLERLDRERALGARLGEAGFLALEKFSTRAHLESYYDLIHRVARHKKRSSAAEISLCPD